MLLLLDMSFNCAFLCVCGRGGGRQRGMRTSGAQKDGRRANSKVHLCLECAECRHGYQCEDINKQTQQTKGMDYCSGRIEEEAF